MKPPTNDPTIPRAEVAKKPMGSGPCMIARATRPATKPTMTDQMMWKSLICASFGSDGWAVWSEILVSRIPDTRVLGAYAMPRDGRDDVD